MRINQAANNINILYLLETGDFHRIKNITIYAGSRSGIVMRDIYAQSNQYGGAVFNTKDRAMQSNTIIYFDV